MSDLIDWRVQGIWPLQDHDSTAQLGTRSHLAAARVVRSDLDLNLPYEDLEDTRGDVLGGLMVRERDDRRGGLQGWWLTGCPVIARGAGDGGTRQRGSALPDGWTPAREARERDERFEDLTLEHPIFGGPLAPDEEQLYPGGWTGLVSAGSDEREQKNILHPDFLGIVAPHADGRERHGTPIWDIDQDGNLDPARFSRFQRLARVARMPPRAGCMPGAAGRAAGLLAWQLGSALDDTDCGGLVADAPSAGAGDVDAGQMLALMSVRHGGPVDVGGPGDQHVLGASEDAEPVDQAHLSTSSLFRGPGAWDCGLEFQLPPYEETRPGQVWLETVLRVDPNSRHRTACGTYAGLGRWETRGMVYAIPPPDEGPPDGPGEPGEGPPPGDPGGPGGPGDPGGGLPPDPFGGPGPTDANPPFPPVEPGGFGDLSKTGFFGVTGAKPSGGKIPGFRPLGSNEKLWVAATLSPMVAPAFALRAQNNTTGAPDWRRASDISSDAIAEYDKSAPIVAQMLGYSATQGGNYTYGNVPGGLGQWRGGDANGGVLVVPGDADMADPATSSRSAYFGMGPNVTFGFGVPGADGSALVNGWRITNRTDGDLNILPVDSSGAPDVTQRTRFQSVVRVGPDDLSANPTLEFGPALGSFVANPVTSTTTMSGLNLAASNGAGRTTTISVYDASRDLIGPATKDLVMQAGQPASGAFDAQIWGGDAAGVNQNGGDIVLSPGIPTGTGLRGGVLIGDVSTDRLGFFGTAVTARPAAYTQTYSTADRTLSAYTPDDESAAYTGINNLQAGNVYATVADLNALRTAYENLRAFAEDVAQLANSMLDDCQGFGLFA